MPTKDIEFYVETRDLSLDVLCLDLIHQLSHLVWRVLRVDGHESSSIDESNRFLTARIARLDGLALFEANGRVECYLIEEADAAGFKFKARRRLFSFEADDFGAPGNWRFDPTAPPDLWYNMTVTTLMMRLDRHG